MNAKEGEHMRMPRVFADGVEYALSDRFVEYAMVRYVELVKLGADGVALSEDEDGNLAGAAVTGDIVSGGTYSVRAFNALPGNVRAAITDRFGDIYNHQAECGPVDLPAEDEEPMATGGDQGGGGGGENHGPGPSFTATLHRSYHGAGGG